MAIIKPISKNQQEISLVSDDGKLQYLSSFMASTGLVYQSEKLCDITLYSVYDPNYYEKLFLYCIAQANGGLFFKKKTFTVSQEVIYYDNKVSKPPAVSVMVTGCKMKGFNFIEANRESGDPVKISLTFGPGKIVPYVV